MDIYTTSTQRAILVHPETQTYKSCEKCSFLPRLLAVIMCWNLEKEKTAVDFVAEMETSVFWKRLITQKIIEDMVRINYSHVPKKGQNEK